MSFQIEDGAGSGKRVFVDTENHLHVRSVGDTETQHAVAEGHAWNINTGVVSITATTAIIYFKNNETVPFYIDAIACGFSDATTTAIGRIYVVKNPTAFSTSTDCDMIENRNLADPFTLNALAYKGVSGSTFTGGVDAALFFQGDNGRLFATVDFVVPPGKAIGLRFEPQYSSGTLSVYAALIGRTVEDIGE